MPVSAGHLAARFALCRHHNNNLPAAASALICPAGEGAPACTGAGLCPLPCSGLLWYRNGLDAIGKTQGDRCIGCIIRGADFHTEVDTQFG